MLQDRQDYMELRDQELLTKLGQQDNHAFQALYTRYAVTLYNAAYKRIPVENIVKDLVQEVFLALFCKRVELQTHPNLKAWLLACTRNLVLRELRNSLIHHRHHQQIAYASDAVTGNTSTYDLKKMEACFHQALEKLTSRSKEIFLLSRIEKMSNRAIATKLNISVNTVEKHMGIALRTMRQEFKEYEVYLVLIGCTCLLPTVV
jgi:RNA polymerase sigma-70 factor (family 1)